MFVILDPGHGGSDPGGGSNSFWKEKDLNLKISKYQANRLNSLGIPNALTRNDDQYLSPSNRTGIINNYAIGKDAILISNHINNGGGKGSEVIYSIKSTPVLGNYIASEIIKTGQNVRNVYTRVNNQGTDYYFVLRDTPYSNSNIVEYGFADNLVDQELLLYNWPVLAESVVRAIANFYNVPYFPPNFIVYVVRRGDSLYKISKNFNTTINKIIKDNNLKSTNLSIGQELFIYLWENYLLSY